MLDASGYKVKVFLCTSSDRSYTKEKAKLKYITLELCILTSREYVHPLAIFSVKTLS
jgi:hypothetical protein